VNVRLSLSPSAPALPDLSGLTKLMHLELRNVVDNTATVALADVFDLSALTQLTTLIIADMPSVTSATWPLLPPLPSSSLERLVISRTGFGTGVGSANVPVMCVYVRCSCSTCASLTFFSSNATFFYFRSLQAPMLVQGLHETNLSELIIEYNGVTHTHTEPRSLRAWATNRTRTIYTAGTATTATGYTYPIQVPSLVPVTLEMSNALRFGVLSVAGMQMTGAYPVWTAYFARVDISHNRLASALPSSMGYYDTRLLRVDHNRFYGPVPYLNARYQSVTLQTGEEDETNRFCAHAFNSYDALSTSCALGGCPAVASLSTCSVCGAAAIDCAALGILRHLMPNTRTNLCVGAPVAGDMNRTATCEAESCCASIATCLDHRSR
jgi:hypothetical protein